MLIKTYIKLFLFISILFLISAQTCAATTTVTWSFYGFGEGKCATRGYACLSAYNTATDEEIDCTEQSRSDGGYAYCGNTFIGKPVTFSKIGETTNGNKQCAEMGGTCLSHYSSLTGERYPCTQEFQYALSLCSLNSTGAGVYWDNTTTNSGDSACAKEGRTCTSAYNFNTGAPQSCSTISNYSAGFCSREMTFGTVWTSNSSGTSTCNAIERTCISAYNSSGGQENCSSVLSSGTALCSATTTIINTTPYNSATTKSQTVSKSHTDTLSYLWNRWGTSGWYWGLGGTSAQMAYNIGVTNLDTGAPIGDNSTINSCTNIRLSFPPLVYTNISWVGTGYSGDSPYGKWTINATPPAVTCDANDFVSSYNDSCTGATFDTYISLVVAPFVRSITNDTSGLDCGLLTGNEEIGYIMDCRVNEVGTLNLDFNFSRTFGKFYYRYYDYRDMGPGDEAPGCYGNNIPMEESYGDVSVSPCDPPIHISQPYTLDFPAKTITYTLNVVKETAVCSPTTAKTWPIGSTGFGSNPVFCSKGEPSPLIPDFPSASNLATTWTCGGDCFNSVSCWANYAENGICSTTTAKSWSKGSTTFGTNPIFCSQGNSNPAIPIFPTVANPITNWTCEGIGAGATNDLCEASLPLYCGDGIINPRSPASCIFFKTIDYMEYPTDSLAKAAYVSSDATIVYSSDITPNITNRYDPSVHSSQENSVPDENDWHAFDGDPATYWLGSLYNTNRNWVKFDLGSGNNRAVSRISINPYIWSSYYYIDNFYFYGAHDDGVWHLLYSQEDLNWTTNTARTFNFENNNEYRYYILESLNSSGNIGYFAIKELELYEVASYGNLVVNSEATVKNQGDYSIKVKALITESINDTLTKTLTVTKNLAEANTLSFDILSNRVGSNIKLGIHDTGGVTTEIIPNIPTPGIWQTINWDISEISETNKDIIDRIVLTIVDASSENIFYIDNLHVSDDCPMEECDTGISPYDGVAGFPGGLNLGGCTNNTYCMSDCVCKGVIDGSCGTAAKSYTSDYTNYYKTNSYIWVASRAANKIKKIDTSGNLIGEYPVGTSPEGTAIDGDGNVWVANWGSGNVTKLDSSGNILGTYTVGTSPRSIAVDNLGNAWIANYGSGNVTKINSSGSVINTFTVGTKSMGIAVDNKKNIWITNINDNTVTKIDQSGNILGIFDTGIKPYGITVDYSENMWIANFGDNTITKLNSLGFNLGTFTVGFKPMYIAIDSSSNVWISNNGDNSITKLDIDGNILGTYTVGSSPYGITIDNSNNVWVSNYGGSSLTKLDSSGNILGTYTIGSTVVNVGDSTGYALRHFVYPDFCTTGTPTPTTPLFPTSGNPIINWTCIGENGGNESPVCTASINFCGNGIKESNEECDTTTFPGGMGEGTCNANQVCGNDCVCHAVTCGDGIINESSIDCAIDQDIDLMEYSTNEAIQSAYISSDTMGTYGSTVTSIMTAANTAIASASSESSASYAAWKSFDSSTSSYWSTSTTNGTGWIKYNFGNGNNKTIRKISIRPRSTVGYAPQNFTLQGSNDDVNWTTILTETGIIWEASVTQSFSFTNEGAYQYYKLNVTATSLTNKVSIIDLKMYELKPTLPVYSESTIKTQGNYSLKGVAVTSDSINDSLTKDIGTAINLTGTDAINFNIYSNRTGYNIKIGIHNSNGVVTEIIPNITNAEAWKNVTWDISEISNNNKNSIDKIIITIIEAGAENTFYIDNLHIVGNCPMEECDTGISPFDGVAGFPGGLNLGGCTNNTYCKNDCICYNSVENGECNDTGVNATAKEWPAGSTSFGTNPIFCTTGVACNTGNTTCTTSIIPNFPSSFTPSTWICLGTGTGHLNEECTATVIGSNTPPTTTPSFEEQYCLSSVALRWTYDDVDEDEQTNYSLQIADNTNDLNVDGTCPECVIIRGGNPATSQVLTIRTDDSGDLEYDTTYFWRVRVINANGSSEWTTTQTFDTPDHPYPRPAFEPLESPLTLTGGRTIATFVDSSRCFDDTGDTLVEYPCSCFTEYGVANNNGLNELCADNNFPNEYTWWLLATENVDGQICTPGSDLYYYSYVEPGIPYPPRPPCEGVGCDPNDPDNPDPTEPNPPTITWPYTIPNSYKPIVRVCDHSEYCCSARSEIKINSPVEIPIWQELSPF